MTDYPLASKALPMRLMCRNWPSRSACNSPSMLFLVALRENVSIPPAYHIPLDTSFKCVFRDGNSMSCTRIQRWLLSFHVGMQVSNKTVVCWDSCFFSQHSAISLRRRVIFICFCRVFPESLASLTSSLAKKTGEKPHSGERHRHRQKRRFRCAHCSRLAQTC
jgi:hypothetical protein